MEFDQNFFTTMALVLMAVLAWKYMPRIMAGVPFVPPSEVMSKMDRGEDVVVIDVRTHSEYAGGHVPGSINLPLGEVRVRLQQLGAELEAYKGLPVYAMCRTDSRASSAARTLKKAGFANLKVIDGGMNAWRRAKLPVEM